MVAEDGSSERSSDRQTLGADTLLSKLSSAKVNTLVMGKDTASSTSFSNTSGGVQDIKDYRNSNVEVIDERHSKQHKRHMRHMPSDAAHDGVGSGGGGYFNEGFNVADTISYTMSYSVKDPI